MIKRITDVCRKRTLKIILLTILFSVICSDSFCQFKKNALVLDLAGKTFSYFDISYERYLSEKFHLGAGVGLGDISTLYINPDEMAKEYSIRFPVYGAYRLGKKKHHALTELGMTIDATFSSFGSSISSLIPFISIGYEFKGENIIIRVPVYLLYIGKNEWYPGIIPWAGFSVGVPF